MHEKNTEQNSRPKFDCTTLANRLQTISWFSVVDTNHVECAYIDDESWMQLERWVEDAESVTFLARLMLVNITGVHFDRTVLDNYMCTHRIVIINTHGVRHKGWFAYVTRWWAVWRFGACVSHEFVPSYAWARYPMGN